MEIIPVQIAIISEILLLAAGAVFFENRGKYAALVLFLGALISMPWFVRLALMSEINYTDGLLYVAYSFSCALSAALFFALAAHLKSGRWINCFFFTLLLVPCAVCFLYGVCCHAVLNVDALIAVWQTNLKEAAEYVCEYATLKNALLLAILLPAVYFLFLRLSDNRLQMPYTQRKNKAVPILMLAALLVSNGLLCYKTSMNSISMIYANALKSVKEYRLFRQTQEKRRENFAASGILSRVRCSKKDDKGVYVLVIGESHNRDYMSAYGYPRENTPWLTQMSRNGSCLLFTRAFSCHTQTIPVLSYALTAKNQYNRIELSDALSLLEVAKAAGYETIWLSNQVKYGMWDTPVSVIASAADRQIWLNECTGNTSFTAVYDGELAKTLDTIKIKEKTLIVLHLMGSHINYDQRYPKEYNRFGTKTDEAMYSNSVLYTDTVLKNIYEKASTFPNFKALLYFSDHASVPKQKLDHDSARFVSSMTHIPMFICLSGEYVMENPGKAKRLETARGLCFTNDLVFNLMLSLMGIECPDIYEKQNDLLNSAYNDDYKRFRTSHGERKIEDNKQ